MHVENPEAMNILDAQNPGAVRIVVHDHTHVRVALEAALETGRGVVLIGGGGEAMGGPWFRHMIAESAPLYPRVCWHAVIDCGTAIGFALAALADGASVLRLRASSAVLERVRDIARQTGAIVDEGTEPVLDLSFHADPLAACRVWCTTGKIPQTHP